MRFNRNDWPLPGNTLEPRDVHWCYGCDKATDHGVRFRSDPGFIGKLLVCQECGETIRQPLGGPGCEDC